MSEKMKEKVGERERERREKVRKGECVYERERIT